MRHKSISNNMLPTEYLVTTKFSLEKRDNFFSIDNLFCGMSLWPNIRDIWGMSRLDIFCGKSEKIKKKNYEVFEDWNFESKAFFSLSLLFRWRRTKNRTKAASRWIFHQVLPQQITVQEKLALDFDFGLGLFRSEPKDPFIKVTLDGRALSLLVAHSRFSASISDLVAGAYFAAYSPILLPALSNILWMNIFCFKYLPYHATVIFS